MRRVLIMLMGVCLMGPAYARSLATHNLSTPLSKNVAYLTQEVSLTQEVKTAGRIGPLTVSSSGFGIEKNAVKLLALPVAGMPVMSVPNPVSQSVVLEMAEKWTQSSLPGYRTRLSGWMRDKGLSSSFYSYTQEVMVTSEGGPKKKAIAFNMSMDQNGRAVYGLPKLIDPDPTILEALYVPLKAADGLPTTWKFPNAGSLQYRLLNKRYEPLTNWTNVNVGGAFDSDNEADPESKLRCLVDRRNAGCGGPTDMRKLMDDTGAAFGVLDYVHRLEPDYERDTDGSLVAKGAISVDQRIWDCSNFINKGYFGYVLTMRAERFLVEPQEPIYQYQKLQEFAGRMLSPTEPYAKSVPISALGGAHPDAYIISPHTGDDTLWSRANPALMKNVIYVAPVVASGGSGELSDAVFSGDMAVRLISSVGGEREYYIGVAGDNYWNSGVYDRNVYFNMDDPQGLDDLAIVQEGFDDWMLVAVNDHIVYIGPRGGDRLLMVRQAYSCGGDDGDCQYRNRVQYGPNSFGSPELSTSWKINQYIDIRPYLRSGQNKIFMRTIVGGGGEGWIKIRTRSCGGSMGLTNGSPPPVPSGAGATGVTQNILQKVSN